MRRKGINEKTTRDRFIDVVLRDSGWTNIVDFKENDNYDFAAVREYETENGPADYVLFHNGRALAAVEAKKLSLGPQNVLVQAERYSKGFQDGEFDFNGNHLPFVYSTNGDARVALQAVRIAARDAEVKGSSSIDKDDIRRALKNSRKYRLSYLLSKLTDQQKTVYEILSKNGSMWSGDLYKECKKEHQDLIDRTYRNHMKKLQEMCLIQKKSSGRWKRYEIV